MQRGGEGPATLSHFKKNISYFLLHFKRDKVVGPTMAAAVLLPLVGWIIELTFIKVLHEAHYNPLPRSSSGTF